MIKGKKELDIWLYEAMLEEIEATKIASSAKDNASNAIDAIANYVASSKGVTGIVTLNILLRMVKDRIDSLNKAFENARDVASTQAATNRPQWLKEHGFNTKVKRLEQKILFTPYADIMASDVPKASSDKVSNSVVAVLRRGLLTCDSSKELANRIKDKSERIIKSIYTDFKTMVNGLYRAVDNIIFYEHKTRVMLCATLDSRVCLECASLNGKVFDIDKAPSLPLHHNCRCILVPEGISGSPPSFSSWISSISDEMAKNVLGASRYKLWKSGMDITELYP